MFDGAGGPPEAPALPAWTWPGGARHEAAQAERYEPDACTTALVDVVDALLDQDPGELPGPVALERCRTVLAQVERLTVVTTDALADAAARELWATDGGGSLSGWLGQQPCGDRGRSTRAKRLPGHSQVRTALATGMIGVATADALCSVLDALPEATEPDQVEGVLTGAVPELLSRWTARNALAPSEDPVADARAELLRETIDAGLANTTATPAGRLEPAFVLLGQALAPTVLATELALLADALQPELLEDAEQATHDGRNLLLRKKRLSPGYRLTGDLTDEVGAALQAELDARATGHRLAQARLSKATDTDGDPDTEAFGTAGPGTPADDRWAVGPGCNAVLDGPAQLTDEQLAHDLLGELLDDVAQVRSPGQPQPVPVTVTAGIDDVEGRVGALPGTLLLPTGPVPLSTAGVRRAGCHSQLTAVLLDALRHPVGASGTHRHATERERRALWARWGYFCAVNGCSSTRTVPHHVRPWWLCGRARLEDLVPICKGHHHDVHEGHRTLRLRDGRLLDELGWIDAQA